MTSVPKPFVSKSTWLKIAAPFAGYAGEVATLVSRIARTQAGRAVQEGIRAGGGSVRIQPPERPTNPPNAWALPTAAEGEGARQVVVFYYPGDWRGGASVTTPPGEEVLFRLLEDSVMMLNGARTPREPEAGPTPAMINFRQERAGST